MALEIDAFEVLRTIAANPVAFADIRADAAKLAGGLAEKVRVLIAKQIKAKSSTLSSIREIKAALGRPTFDGVVDTLTDKELATLVGKLDKHHPNQKAADAAWRRAHLRALVSGDASPVLPPEKKPKRTGPKTKAATGRAGGASKGGKAGGRRRKTAEEDEYVSDPSAGAVRDKARSD